MKLLVLGGTQFVGRACVEAALVAGHDVTLFHRGRTNPDLFPEVEHVLGDRDGGLAPLEGRTWDACLDVCGYVPRVVAQSVDLLGDAVGRYGFVSTISVYADFREPAVEDGRLAELDDPTVEEITGGSYGGLKVLCEREVERQFGERALLVRPGFVVGAHDPTGRFTYWVHRAAAGGEMLVPASLAETLQFVDARDLADFTLGALEDGRSGAYNVTGPVPQVTMVDVVAAADGATPVVVDDAFLARRELDFRALPLWFHDPELRELMRTDVSRALDVGLTFRPLGETVRAILGDAEPVEGVGLPAEHEAELLAAWRGE
ncbi:MAG TPA: NAD-dependent epimerase/dehydratase family protein [Gaiellaceae bacterium]|nr:NAD-dependent epimerase/dehydratase family protein [Gaiellaceae bacterium]